MTVDNTRFGPDEQASNPILRLDPIHEHVVPECHVSHSGGLKNRILPGETGTAAEEN